MSNKNEFESLIGKTILSAKKMRPVGYDDEGYLKLSFSDGSSIILESTYCGYTGNSLGEYSTDIEILTEQSIKRRRMRLEELE